MKSRIDPANDPYAPRWAGHSPDQRRSIHASSEIGEDVSVGAGRLVIGGLRVPHSLDPEMVSDPWPMGRARFRRPLRLMRYLAVAGSVAAVVSLVVAGKLSLSRTLGAAQEAKNGEPFGSHSAPPVVQFRAEPGDQGRSGVPRALAASTEEPSSTPLITALAPVERTQVPNTRAEETRGPDSVTATSARSLDAQSDEIATLVRRGEQLAAAGDMAAARLLLRRAAEEHNARAALALGATYDPNVLQSLGIYGVTPDIAEARNWYEKAKEYGSAEALRRLEMLASRSQ